MRLNWAELEAVKAAALKLDSRTDLSAAYGAAIGKYKAEGGALKKAGGFKNAKGAGDYFRKAKATVREKQIFEQTGVVILKPDRIPNPLNGGIPSWLTGLVICCVVLTYVFFGGLRGAAWANTSLKVSPSLKTMDAALFRPAPIGLTLEPVS